MHLLNITRSESLFQNQIKTAECEACQQLITSLSGSLQGKDVSLVYKSVNAHVLQHNMLAADTLLSMYVSKLCFIHKAPQESVSSCVFCMLISSA